MQVSVDIKGLPQVIDRLRGVPGGSRLAISWAIIFALKRGRTAAARDARSRYIIQYGWLLKAIGSPRMSGMTGFLRVSGTKAPLSMFNPKSTPHGVTFQELKTGPSLISHAFVHGSGPVLTRETRTRYPLRSLFGLSAAQMIGQRTEVFPKLQASLQADVDKELARVMRLVLDGQIIPKV